MKTLKGLSKTFVIGLALYFLGEIAIGDDLRHIGVLCMPIFSFICGLLGAFCHDD